MSDKTAAQVAAIFGCSRRKVTDLARAKGIGYNLAGRAGWRFTDADVDKLRRAMTPPPAIDQRRSA
jgi:hypothetical protein